MHLVLLSVLLHPHNMQKPHLCLQRAEEKSHCNKNPSSLPNTHRKNYCRHKKTLSFYINLTFLEIFSPSGEASYWERGRMKEVGGEDGLDQEVMLEGISNSKSHGQR